MTKDNDKITVADLCGKMEKQFAYGRDRLEDLQKAGDERGRVLHDHMKDTKKSIKELEDRTSKLELAKIYAEGFKSGAVWAIGAGVASILAAAVWLVNKLNSTAP